MLRVSAPGKAILMGEHAAVHGRPALVAAIDRRLTATLVAGARAGVRLDLPQLGVRERHLTWQEVHKTRRRGLAALVDGEPGRLVEVALSEAAAFAGSAEEEALALHLHSDIPIGSGFGSSAAVAVGVAGGYLAWRGVEISRDELHRLTLRVEKLQHGNPSGVDNAAVIHGGLLWARRRGDGQMETTPLALGSKALGRVRAFHTGPPTESTGEVVEAVGALGERAPERFVELLAEMEASTREARSALESEGAAGVKLRACFRRFESCLEELGVVPEAVRERVRRVEARGGAAKVSGAGSLTGPGAGSLLVYPPAGIQADELASWDGLQPFEALDLQLGAEGFRVESDARV